MSEERNAVRFRQAAALLPPHLRRPVERLDGTSQARVEELRLRAGRPLTLVCPEGERTVPGAEAPVRSMDLSLVLEIATQASAHTALERVRNGFFTVRGGHRIGICGSGVVRDGEVRNLRQLSSLAIRVAREVPGLSAAVLDRLWSGGVLQSTLLLSPPGGGKTTLLRDLIRAVSDGEGGPALRVGVADERGELAAMYQGEPQFSIGRQTDVLDGCPKGPALLMLLRGMNPQVLAADEITAPEDAAALEMAANCGVSLLCTAHAGSLEELKARPLYRRLLDEGLFRRLAIIERAGRERRYQVGALLLAGGAGALGCSAAAQLSRRVAVLRALLGALEGMEREIAFRLTPMPELLERAAAESPPPVCTLFARCRTLLDELGERSMAELWREALEQVPLGLDGPGRLALEELGEVLGRYDGDGQREALAHTRAELSRALEQAREAREKQGRMYQVLGITAGAFLVILLL